MATARKTHFRRRTSGGGDLRDWLVEGGNTNVQFEDSESETLLQFSLLHLIAPYISP
jgi:hypothetical protein